MEKVVRAVEVTPLPDAAHGVLGIISVAGNVVPVFELRTRFGLPRRGMRITDHLAIVRTSRRTLALLVDAPVEVTEVGAAEVTPADPNLSGVSSLSGIVQRAGGIVLIHDLECFLSADDERTLDGALTGTQNSTGANQSPHAPDASSAA